MNPATATMSAQTLNYTRDQLTDIAQQILALARAGGATACEADVSEGVGLSLTVRRQEVDTLEYNRDKGVGVSVYIGQRRGHASTSDFSPSALQATVDAALSIARFTAEDSFSGLPDEALLAHNCPDLDLDHPWPIEVDDAIALASRCEAAAFDADKRISNSEGASVSVQRSHFISANSLGFLGGFASTRHGLSCSVIAGSGDAMQRDYWYDSQRRADQLESAEAIGRCSAERAVARLGARRVPTGEYPVIFAAPLSVGLLGNFVQAVSGGALYRKSSFLVDSLGTQVFAPQVTILERPHLPCSFGASWFDSEGVATHDRDVVTDGVLNGYFLSSYSARKLGMQTTGNAGGSHHLIMSNGGCSFDSLVARMGRGLIVTELLGQGVNYVTGDYSRGAAGFWVEGGEIQHAVEEITIAGNLRDMFLQIVDIADDALPRGAKRCGSVLIEHMTVAGD